MLKTQVKPRAEGKWFHCKVLNILTSFLWSFPREVSRKIEHYTKRKTVRAIITSFSWCIPSQDHNSQPIRVGEIAQLLKQIYSTVFFKNKVFTTTV